MLNFVLAVCCSISGTVRAVSGDPVAHARVALQSAPDALVSSDKAGNFTLNARRGDYRLDVSAAGYASVTVGVKADHDVRVVVALEPLDSPKLRQIGTVTVDDRLLPVQGAIPAVVLERPDLDRLGYDRIIDGLKQLPGATFARPDGGSANAVTVVALRGPDPSESLIALDGQLLNDGNTGDLDLSRLPVAAFSAVDVSEGLGPEDSNGSNTFGGSIDLISLRPTKEPHYAVSLADGSFGRSEAWLNATGSVGRLGYATALDEQHEAGYVNETVPLFSTSDPACAPCATHLGSSVASHLALGTLTWSFAQNADVTARLFALGDERDQSSAINGIDRVANDTGTPQYGRLIGPGAQTFAQDIRAYQIRGRAPLGADEVTADLSESDNSDDVAGGSVSPYDITHRDRRTSAELAWHRTLATAQFSVGGYLRHESIDFLAPPAATTDALSASLQQPLLGQSIGVVYARGGFQPTPRLRLDAALFESRYSTFGSNLDGRFSAIGQVGVDTSVRFSLGTGFRAPLLVERYQFPYDQLPLDANNVFVGQGSPNEHPEHATELELGLSHEFAKRATLDVSLYRTNLRNPIEIFYPLAAVASGRCSANSYAQPLPNCVSYQSNVGNAVYEGAEIRLSQSVVPRRVFLTASYGVNVSYPRDLDAQFSNPTSGANLVDNAQFLGVPQQQGSLQLDWNNAGWHAATSTVVRGKNNELNAGPFAVVDALVGKHIDRHVDLSLQGVNLFNAEAGPFTQFGAGQPYRGIVGQGTDGRPMYGPLPTDALAVEPAAVRLILTIRN